MSETWLVASFEIQAEPKLLPTRAAAEAAIARQQIDHFTPVTIRLPSGDRQTMPAGEIAQFRELLGDPPVIEEPDSPSEAAVETASEAAVTAPEPVQTSAPPADSPTFVSIADPAIRRSLDRVAPAARAPLQSGPQSKFLIFAGLLGFAALVMFLLTRGPLVEAPVPVTSSETSEAAPAASDAASLAAADPASEAAAVASEATARPSDSGDGDCRTKRDAMDRLLCEDTGLRSADARLRGSWNAARRRMSSAGQRVEPLATVRQRIATCRNAVCAQRAFAFEAQRLDQLQPVPQAAPSPSPVAVAAPRCAPRAATPRGNPGSWVTSGDYPSRALRAAMSGTVAFQAVIGLDGRVTACRITSSSGHSELDEATCRLVTRRARFSPASNEACQPAEGTYSNRVRWILPE